MPRMASARSLRLASTLPLAFALAVAVPACSASLSTSSTPAHAGKARLAQVKADNMPETGEWTGVFFHATFGNLHLVHHGASATGRWKRADGSAWGELSGQVTGNLLKFDWTEHAVGMAGPSAIHRGKGYFVYRGPAEPGGDDRLMGEWGLGGDEVGNAWDCIKQRNMPPDLKGIGGTPDPGQGGGGWE